MAPHPIEQVLASLNAAGVRYLVVGGVAVVLHGHLRTTADLDLVVALDDANAQRAVEALQALGFTPRAPVAASQFADAAARAGWIAEKGLTVVSLPDLLAMKRHAGRPQDQADVAALEAIAGRGNA